MRGKGADACGELRLHRARRRAQSQPMPRAGVQSALQRAHGTHSVHRMVLLDRRSHLQ